MLSYYYGFWDEWQLYHKVTFDGPNRLIIVNPYETEIDVKIDIYSAWKRWVQLYDYAKFEPALRNIGGDSIGSGLFAGDLYFTINNWQVYINHSVNVNGVIFSDDYDTPFLYPSGTSLVTNRVSQLVQTVAPQIDAGDVSIPTTADIVTAMDTTSVRLASIDTTVTSTLDTTLSSRASGTALVSLDSKVDTKASQTSVDAIGTTVTTNLDAAVSSRASQSSVNTVIADVAITDAKIDGVVTDIAAVDTKLDTKASQASVDSIPADVRTELDTELTHLLTLQNGQGLDTAQATMLLEIYRLYGLDPTRPLVVTNSSRNAGAGISQTIVSGAGTTTVTRNP